MSVLDKIRKMKSRDTRGGGSNGSLKGIFHDWQDGPNNVRLVGDFLEVKTHFIAPAPKRKDRGLCQEGAFKGDDKIPMVINCPDWDIDKEEAKKKKVCGICKLHEIANQVLAENPGPAEKKQYEALRGATRQRTLLKWNILDRDNPTVKSVENGVETEVLAYKMASIGMEAWDDINGIFDQCKIDISGVDEGVDICITKAFDGKKNRVAYSAKAIIDGTSLRLSPLTEEERELTLHDLKRLAGKQTDPGKVVDALHGDLRDIYDLSVEEEEAEEEVVVPVRKAKPEPEQKPVVKKRPVAVVEEEDEEVEVDDDDDEDDSPFSKKK